MIKPDGKNANRGTKRGRELLRQSLQELGGGRSILLDRGGNIVAGNKTFEGAQEVGLKVRIVQAERGELVAIQREDLDLNDPAGEARRLAYLDNRVGELDLEWDAQQMADDMAAGALLEDAGFLEGELRVLLEQAGIEEQVMTDPGDQTDKAEALRVKWGVEAGQVWTLGDHRLICGDATDLGVIERVMAPPLPYGHPPFQSAEMGGERAALAFTSPPYWVGKEYETQTSEAEIDAFIAQICMALDRAVRKDESRIVINTSTGFNRSFDKKAKRQVLLLVDKWTNEMRRQSWNLRHVRHWLKDGQVLAKARRTDIIDQHNEFLATYEHAEGAERRFDDVFGDDDVQLLMTYYNTQGQQRGQEWTGATWALLSCWSDIRGNAVSNGHVAAFPVELPLRHLMLYSQRGEVVFEPFSGSGTTIIACEALKRRCRAVEIGPGYVAASLERWSVMTGRTPVLEAQ